MLQAHFIQSANYTVGVVERGVQLLLSCFLSRCTMTVHSPTAIYSGQYSYICNLFGAPLFNLLSSSPICIAKYTHWILCTRRHVAARLSISLRIWCALARGRHMYFTLLHYYSFNNHWQLWTYGKKAAVLCYVVISVHLHLLLEQVNSLGTALILPKVCLKHQFSYQYQIYSLASKFMWKESHWNCRISEERGYQGYSAWKIFWHTLRIWKGCLNHTQPTGFTSVLSYLYHCFRYDLVICLGWTYSSLFLPPRAQHYPYRFLRHSTLSVPRKEKRTCRVYLLLPLPNAYHSMSIQMISTGMGQGTITILSR
jgi:hypothetical protein